MQLPQGHVLEALSHCVVSPVFLKPLQRETPPAHLQLNSQPIQPATPLTMTHDHNLSFSLGVHKALPLHACCAFPVNSHMHPTQAPE